MLDKPVECSGCPFEARGRGFVPGCGPKDALGIVIGEAPAAEEIPVGLPFQGKAGDELNGMLAAAGLSRDELYITNAVKCAFPSADIDENTKHHWAQACFDRHGRQEWNYHVSNANAVALLGSIALTTYTPLSGINKHRGYVELDSLGVKIIPMLHPANTMRWDRGRKLRPVARQDWKKFARLLHVQGPVDTKESFITEPTFEEALMFLGRILKLKLPIGYDIETTGLNIHDCTVTCIGIGDFERVLCIPIFRDDSSLYWEMGQLTRLVELLSDIFADPDISKTAANSTFDESVLLLRGFAFNGYRDDVMYRHHQLFAELPHRVAFLGSIYTDAAYWKDDVKGYEGAETNEGREIDAVYWTYNCKDVHYQNQTSVAMKREAASRDLLTFYDTIIEPVLPAIADMQATGIRFDNEKRLEIAHTMEQELAVLEGRVYAALGREFQIGSKDELATIIFSELGYTATKFTAKRGRPTVDKDTVRWLWHHAQSDSDREFFGALKQYNETYKLYSTYVTGEDVQPCSDGRIRASWKVHGTKTGRLACGEPNFMNVPDGLMREMYIPSEGRTFLNLDMDGFEAWIGALISGDGLMLEVLRSGKSPHLANAVTFGVCASYEEAEALRASGNTQFAMTYLALKNYFYGEQYGAEPSTIHTEMYSRMDHPPDLQTVAHWHSLHRAAHPAFATMRSEIAEQLRRTRLLRNGFGRERYHLGPPETIITEGYNFPIQSLGADILLQIQAQLFQRLDYQGIIVAQVHDSLLLDVPNHLLEKTYHIAKDAASKPFTFTGWHGQTITHGFDCSFKAGRSWGTLEKWELAA